MKGTLAITPTGKDALATLQVDKRVNDSDLTLKASYQLRGDVVIVEVRAGGRRARRQRLPPLGNCARSLAWAPGDSVGWRRVWGLCQFPPPPACHVLDVLPGALLSLRRSRLPAALLNPQSWLTPAGDLEV